MALALPSIAFCQPTKPYFQQQVDHQITVTLNDSTHSLDGFETIFYTNNSPDTLHFIWFHLWPNAYKNDRTAFGEQMLNMGDTRFYFSEETERGYINGLDFKVNDQQARWVPHPRHEDIIKLLLPAPLSPGQRIKISTPFHVKLPHIFSRSGHTGSFYQVTQWYPKPAVYDRKGWHPMPYLEQGEFYNEFGNYEVTIKVPEAYQVAATGLTKHTGIHEDNKTTFHVEQKNVHDFAWFAAKDLVINTDSLTLESGRVIHINTYYTASQENQWKNSNALIRESLLLRNDWLGDYPYNVMNVISVPAANAAGMEYPAIVTVAADMDEDDRNDVLVHEIGHQWLYGIVGNNERDHPWMDEGINSFYDYQQKRLEQPVARNFIERMMASNWSDVMYRHAVSEKTDQAIALPSAAFSPNNYDAIVYHKSALWLQQLESYIGRQTFDSCVRQYVKQWQFRHPYPEDFREVIETISKKDVSHFFAALHRKGPLQAAPNKTWKIKAVFDFSQTEKYNYLFVSPAFGGNYYDKVMAGILVHNYTLPVPRFHFLAAPMFATGSKKFVGIGRAAYSTTSYGKIRKTEIAVSASAFSKDIFTDASGKKNFLGFTKLVPSIRLTFRNKDPLSEVTKYLQWKTFFIDEENLSFIRDTVTQQDLITFPTTNRYINQLSFVLKNERALYPYTVNAYAEQAREFMKLNLEGNYFFNYPKGGGMQLRFFAGKFIYAGEKTPAKRFTTDRYHLNMSGANGYEDYTYSNYFMGRNEFQNLPSQQMAIRDGGFKVRTDLLADKVGRSDDWLVAINLSTSIPPKINLLNISPVRIPLKIFFDAGTYAGAWDKHASSAKFIYDAGLQLSLFKDVVNIYFPMLYSKVYRDYFKSTLPKGKRFWQNISFNIDLNKIRNLVHYPGK